ncbi:MAG: hypothetical protein HUU16_00190 [Candidatus Omnitrophica bacterium]|nr:hypothetical protein [bacterium]NUN94568.1 hypothetical protein [Candidatus Omnitrophota bacterium]
MSVAGTLEMKLTVNETLPGNAPASAASKKVVTHDQWNLTQTFPVDPSLPCTEVVSVEATLVAGALTLDLTALTATNGATRSMNGLKLQMLFARPDPANANPIIIKTGATNGYAFKGAAWSDEIKPGQASLYFGNEQAPDVGASAKNIDLTGTGSQKLRLEMVFG